MAGVVHGSPDKTSLWVATLKRDMENRSIIMQRPATNRKNVRVLKLDNKYIEAGSVQLRKFDCTPASDIYPNGQPSRAVGTPNQPKAW